MKTENYNQLSNEKNYDYITTEQGHIEAVNKETGEVMMTKTVTVPVGSIVYTPDQQEAYKQRKEKERQSALRRNGSPKFTFVNTSSEYKDIPAETVGRLMYLCTYVNYSSNSLAKTQKTKIPKKELPDILRLPRTTFLRFWEDVNGKYLFEDKEGYISISNVHFVRGKLPYVGGEWQKVYQQPLRELYRTLPRTSHRYLGYIFQLLPYLNYEYNVLCHNPAETDIEKIKFMTIDEFCLACGYTNKENRTKLIKKYYDIWLDVKGHKEAFCSFVRNTNDMGRTKIFVNPNIIYKGSKWNEVKILGEFSK